MGRTWRARYDAIRNLLEIGYYIGNTFIVVQTQKMV